MYTHALNCTDPILSVQLKHTKFSSCSVYIYIYMNTFKARYENLISSNLALFGIALYEARFFLTLLTNLTCCHHFFKEPLTQVSGGVYFHTLF